MLTSSRSLVALAIAFAALQSAVAQSQAVLSRDAGVIAAADCSESKSSSTVGQIAGGVGGGAVGGVLGGVVGSMFGKTGARIGAALGATGGAVAGGKLATTTRYHCTLEVTSGEKTILVDTDLDKKPHVGDKVRVLTMEDGSKRVMFAR